MSVKSAEMYMNAKKGNKVCCNPGPLDDKSREEWIRWLDYIPDFYRQRIDCLSTKEAIKLSDEELMELITFRKEFKMRDIGKNFQNPETSVKDRLEYLKYTAHQEILENLIHKKLTAEEYKMAMAKIYEIVEKSSLEKLSQYCQTGKNNFDTLSMIDLFILREVGKELRIQSNIDLGNKIASSVKGKKMFVYD